MHSVRNLLICGLIAGACAGLLAAGFAKVAGEPAVGNAISFEESHEDAAPPVAGHDHAADGHGEAADHHESGPVSRGVQSTIGLLTACLIFGISMGGFFALAFAVVYGRVGRDVGPRKTALLMAGFAFLIVYLVPFIKYPANPPSVGSPATIGERTLLYVLMIAISISSAVAALRLRRTLTERVSGFNATMLAVLSYLGIVLVAGLALPAVNEVPAAFPATTLWNFRVASVGTVALLWMTIGLVFSSLATAAMTRQRLLPALQR